MRHVCTLKTGSAMAVLGDRIVVVHPSTRPYVIRDGKVEELNMTDGSGHIGPTQLVSEGGVEKDEQGNIVDIGDKWSKKWKPPRFGYTMLAEMNLTQTQIWSSEDATSIIVRLVDGTELEYLVRGHADAKPI